MFREVPELNNEENIPEKPEESIEMDAKQPIETEEPYPLKEPMQRIVKSYFEEKGFEVLEMTDTHVKVKSSKGGEMTIPNKIAIETAGGGRY